MIPELPDLNNLLSFVENVALIVAIAITIALSVLGFLYFLFLKFPISELLYALEDLWHRHGRRYAGSIIRFIIAGVSWIARFIFTIVFFVVRLPYLVPRALWGLWRGYAMGGGMRGPGRSRITRVLSWVWRKIKQGLNWATQDVRNASIILAGPILLVFIVRFFIQWESERETWRQVLTDTWDSMWFWIAVAALLITGVAYLREHPAPSPRFVKICLKIVLIGGILLLLSPFLFRMAEKGVQQTSIQLPSIGGSNQSAPSDTFAPGVTQKDGKAYATITGREEKGLTVLSMPPGSTYRVCYVQGKITSYEPSTGKNSPQEIWGDTEGYIRANPQHVALDWRPNFRYWWAPGVLPYATLAIVGAVGSGQEKIVLFPSGNFCTDATNNGKEVQPLNLYYHALQSYWWQTNDGYLFPTQASAVGFGRTNSVKYDGWQDQGKDGGMETFVITPVP